MKPEILEACLLGGALGDSIGLPSEGINARRIAKLRPGTLRQCLIAGKGMVSDDTEHAVMTLLSLMEAGNDPQLFGRKLAARLRGWLASIPAGIGLATARSILKLAIGIHPERSGVWSAGNGPLMRAPVIGAWHADAPDLREALTRASTLMTHRDPRALEAAHVIAGAAAIATLRGGAATNDEVLAELEKHLESTELKARFTLLRQGLAERDAVGTFTARFLRKQGYVTGFAPDSAATAIYAWLRHRGDFRKIIESVVRAGGDTDTTAFIAGSIAGIECGRDALPEDWLDGLRDWPIDRTFISKISNGIMVSYPGWPILIPRNFTFLMIVLGHGFRRLLPPY